MPPSMMESILMRKCQVSYKEAKHLTALAKQQLRLPDESTLLWSKEYETKCIDIYHSINNNSKSSNGDTTNVIRPSTRPTTMRLQRHHSDSTDGNRSRNMDNNSNDNDRLHQNPRIDLTPKRIERRKSRSLSKSRRTQSPATIVNRRSNNNTKTNINVSITDETRRKPLQSG